MKEYNPSVFGSDIWKSLHFRLWGAEVSGMEKGASIDGIEPERIETNKEGIDIEGSCSFLRGAKKNEYSFRMNYRLLRPRFSSLQSVTESRIRNSKVERYEAQDGWVEIEIS